MPAIKGLEKLYFIVQRDIKSPEDCVVAALHTMLTNAGLSCIGLGDSFSDQHCSDDESELLPQNWNENQNSYCLRYRSQNKNLYLLKVTKAGGNLHVDLVMDKEKYSHMAIPTAEFVSEEDMSTFSKTYKNLEDLSESFKKNIMGPMKSPSEKSDEKKSSDKTANTVVPPVANPNPQVNPVRNPNPLADPMPFGVPDTRRQGRVPDIVPRIGGRDLDPFGRGIGGMHFDPVGMGVPFGGSGIGPFGGGPPGYPSRMAPPGARFDPFSPITPNRFDPDPDHFRPPDYDNMFM